MASDRKKQIKEKRQLRLVKDVQINLNMPECLKSIHQVDPLGHNEPFCPLCQERDGRKFVAFTHDRCCSCVPNILEVPGTHGSFTFFISGDSIVLDIYTPIDEDNPHLLTQILLQVGVEYIDPYYNMIFCVFNKLVDAEDWLENCQARWKEPHRYRKHRF